MGAGFRRVTRADVARRAQVSETIVSYVINNNRYVDSQKKERVLQAIRELNYKPNLIARALKGKGSNSILFIADQISNEHFSKLVSEMDAHAYDRGYLISLCANHNSEEFVSQIISRQYDGIVISSISFEPQYIRRFSEVGIPVVLLMNRDYDEPFEGVGKINTGLQIGAMDCVKYLVSTGRRNILYLDRFSKNGNFSGMSDLRLRGFTEQMTECALAFSPQNIVTGCADESEVIASIQQRILGGFPVDAIFGRNDRLACLAIEAVEQLGLRIPQDIAIIGFDNSSLGKYIRPRLTTVEIQRAAIGKAVIEMLQGMINGQEPKTIQFSTKLIIRDST